MGSCRVKYQRQFVNVFCKLGAINVPSYRAYTTEKLNLTAAASSQHCRNLQQLYRF